MKIIGIIPARFASTRFPGKPLVKILGKTLLQRTFERANSSQAFDEIYVATDDSKIFAHAQEIKAQPIMTSVNCINGTERIIEVLNKLNVDSQDIIVNVQGDHPVLCPHTIQETIKILKEDKTAVMSTAASLFKDQQEALSPYNVKVVLDNQKNALYFSRSLIPYSKNLDKSKHYYHIGIYAYRAGFLKGLEALPPTENQLAEDLEQLKILEHGFKIKVAVVEEPPLGVDTFEDIQKIESFLCQ